MSEKMLEEIADYAIRKLEAACGVDNIFIMEGDELTMITATNFHKKRSIKITIEEIDPLTITDTKGE